MIDIDRVIGQWNVFDLAFQEFDVLRARLALVFVRQRQHFVRHVEPVGFAVRPDAPGGEQHVNAAARAQIKHGLAGIQIRQCGRVAAAERSQHRFLGNLPRLRRVVQVRGDRIAREFAGRRSSAATTAAALVGNAQGRLSVFFFYDFLDIDIAIDDIDVCIGHDRFSYLQSWTRSRGFSALFRVQHSA